MLKLVFLLLIFANALYAQRRLFTGEISNSFKAELYKYFQDKIVKEDEEKKKLPYFKNDGK